MKIEHGINPNCSETVIRIASEDYDNLPPEIMGDVWSFSEPTDGYSSMRPLPGMECLYFYQTSGSELQDWLEENRIHYDIEAPFQEQLEQWELLEPTQEESELERDGGGGIHYRRKPYES